MFKGWSVDGIQEYNTIIEHVMNDRKNGHDFEEKFMHEQALKLERAKAQKYGETNHNQQSIFQTITCYDDLGDSDENAKASPSHDTHSSATDTPSSLPLSSIYPMGQLAFDHFEAL